MTDAELAWWQADCRHGATLTPSQCLALIDEVERLRKSLAAATAKWMVYEQEYILPCFDMATRCGIDLRGLLRENPGKNCVILLVERLRAEVEVRVALERKRCNGIAETWEPTNSDYNPWQVAVDIANAIRKGE
jgi:hypothetical protein